MGMGMGVGVGRKGKVILRVVAGGARLHSVKFIRGEGGMGGGEVEVEERQCGVSRRGEIFVFRTLTRYSCGHKGDFMYVLA